MKKFIKKLILITFSLVLLMSNIYYAKVNPFSKEVKKPVAESKNNKSESTIYYSDSFKEFSPINPVPAGVNKEEYDKVDNYTVDLNTIESRIKYFSPTYKNIKSGAESSLWMAFYLRGGNIGTADNYKKYNSDILDEANSFKDTKTLYEEDLKKLTKGTSEYNEKKALIEKYDILYKSTMSAYYASNNMATYMMSSAGHKKALNRIMNVDNMTAITNARETITKNIKSLVMTYLQLNMYADILKKQQDLYQDMYKLSLSNHSLGIATAIEVSENLNKFEDSKATYKSTMSTLKNLKSQLAYNLGYKLGDVDKLVFVEPEIDMQYIENISIDEDRDKSYNSNVAYQSIKIDSASKKYPGSTGEQIYNKRKQYTAEKVVIELENLYEDLQAKLITYQGSYYLTQICAINEEANKRKLDNNLISKLEYDGLELQNLANKLSVQTAKYDLINATNNYYYGTLGQITIS